MKKLLFILASPIFLSGCLHKVDYKLSKSDRWTGPRINGVVCIQPIADHTFETNFDWRPQQLEHIGKEVWRTNFRGGYNHTNLTADVTAIFVKHLSYSGLFTKVVSGTDTNADYFLSGNLVDFRTHGRVNQTAENVEMGAAVGFGLAGVLVGSMATASMKSEIKSSVKLDDLKLTDKLGQIFWHDSISISNDVMVNFEEVDPAVIDNYPDQALKDAVNEMIRRLGNSSLTNHVNQ